MKRKWWIVLDAAFLTVMAGLMLSLWSGSGSTPAPQSVAPVLRADGPSEQLLAPPIIEIPEPAKESQPVPPTAEPGLPTQQGRPLLSPYKLPGLPRLWRVQ